MRMYKPSDIALKTARYLDCPCEFFPPMADDAPLRAAYESARQEGKTAGFTPVLATPNETLWECLTMNADPENESPSPEQIRSYRARALQESRDVSGAALLTELIAEYEQDYAEDEMDWQELLGQMQGGRALNSYGCFWPYDSKTTSEVILAKIPTARPWEIFAWLPMGNWNECPDTLRLIAIARHWHETCGAVPVALTHDELEFCLESPVTNADLAKRTALEHYAFCPDRIYQCDDDGSVGKLADTLRKSTVWYFWWD